MRAFSHHRPWVLPVEFLTSDGKGTSHALEDIAHVLQRVLNVRLVGSLSFVNGEDDVFSVGVGEGDVSKLLGDATVDVASLKVVVVDLDGARKRVVLRVHEPRGLPLATPEVGEVGVDAADVDLQVAVLVEAQAGARSAVSVLSLNVGVYSRLDASPIKWREVLVRKTLEVVALE